MYVINVQWCEYHGHKKYVEPRIKLSIHNN